MKCLQEYESIYHAKGLEYLNLQAIPLVSRFNDRQTKFEDDEIEIEEDPFYVQCLRYAASDAVKS